MRLDPELRCLLQRHAGVLVWVPVLLLGPVFALPAGTGAAVAALALLAVMAATSVAAVLASRPRLALGAWLVLAAAVVTGTAIGVGWLPVWVLLAITAPAVLRGRRLLAALGLVVAGSVVGAWLAGATDTAIQVQAFVVSLSGAATTSFLRLSETVQELQRTRRELARVAVAEERERLSRDLHDLLGHTLSVMVVKAQAVRRLAATDPDAAAAHAADIESVGRSALTEVREAVDAMRAPSLGAELDGAKRALDAAGIVATIDRTGVAVPPTADEALAWVVREATTNVLRHSGAARCRIELSRAGSGLRLSVRDDGVGGPPAVPARSGGLDGLRRRLVATGGRLEAGPDDEGFRVVATVGDRR